MLILRRKKNESLLIGENIRITVIECAGDGVRLAIDAPKQISILREELSEAEQSNKTSVGIDPLFFIVFLVIALAFGLITPPVGVCLYAATNVSGLSMEKISKSLVPWLLLLVAGLLVFIVFPQIITVPINILFGG